MYEVNYLGKDKFEYDISYIYNQLVISCWPTNKKILSFALFSLVIARPGVNS